MRRGVSCCAELPPAAQGILLSAPFCAELYCVRTEAAPRQSPAAAAGGDGWATASPRPSRSRCGLSDTGTGCITLCMPRACSDGVGSHGLFAVGWYQCYTAIMYGRFCGRCDVWLSVAGYGRTWDLGPSGTVVPSCQECTRIIMHSASHAKKQKANKQYLLANQPYHRVPWRAHGSDQCARRGTACCSPPRVRGKSGLRSVER